MRSRQPGPIAPDAERNVVWLPPTAPLLRLPPLFHCSLQSHPLRLLHRINFRSPPSTQHELGTPACPRRQKPPAQRSFPDPSQNSKRSKTRHAHFQILTPSYVLGIVADYRALTDSPRHLPNTLLTKQGTPTNTEIPYTHNPTTEAEGQSEVAVTGKDRPGSP